VREHPELVKKYLGSVVPTSTTSSRRSTPRSSPTARSSTSPGRALPDGAVDLFPHQRRKNTGQFERTLIIADKGAT
jgi:Fe-S cluster assembly protein SufB